MGLKTYQVKKCYFNEVEEETVTLPASAVFICDPGEVGPIRYVKEEGFEHYLGAVYRSDIDEEYWKLPEVQTPLVRYHSFGDIVLFFLDNIKPPLGDFPVVDSKTFVNRFSLDKYFIRFKSRTQVKYPGFKIAETTNNGKLDQVKVELERAETLAEGGETLQIYKILDVKSAYKVKIAMVTVKPIIGNQELQSIVVDNCDHLERLLSIRCVDVDILKGPEIEAEFKQLIDSVLEPLNFEIIICNHHLS